MTNPFKYIYWRWWCVMNDVCFKHRLPKEWKYRCLFFPECRVCYSEQFEESLIRGIEKHHEYERKFEEFQNLP